jgi:hypothetical protein
MATRLTGRNWEAARRKARLSLAQISDEEDAELTRAAEGDSDNPILDERMFAPMRPAAEVAPEIVHRARGQRGSQKSTRLETPR